MEWASVFNIIGFSIIFFALRKFAGDGFNELFKFCFLIVLAAIVIKNHKEVMGIIDHLSNQWWPILKQMVLNSSDNFSSFIGGLMK